MSLFKRKNKQKENEILFENLTTSQMNIERPNIDTINRIINKCKDKFNTLKQIDLSELSYCFKDNSLETILKVLINVENDYNDGLIKDMSYKVFYPYIMKENNSDIEDNIDIDEKKYNSKIGELVEEFKNPIFVKNLGVSEENVNVQFNFKISEEQLYKWKLGKIVKKYSKELIKCLHTDDDKIICLIKDIIRNSYLFMDKKMTIGFITKIYCLSQAHGVNIALQNQIKKLSEIYA